VRDGCHAKPRKKGCGGGVFGPHVSTVTRTRKKGKGVNWGIGRKGATWRGKGSQGSACLVSVANTDVGSTVKQKKARRTIGSGMPSNFEGEVKTEKKPSKPK